MNFQSEATEEKATFGRINEIIEKLKKDKKALFIITVGLIGMILIVFSGDKDKKSVPQHNDTESYEAYNAEIIKQELTRLIESISGAGEAMVMITYKSNEETVFATDTEDVVRDDETKTKKNYVVIKNNSDESGIPLKIIYPEVKGVAVICEGGDNKIVQEKIYSIVCALFSLSSNSVSIASMA